MRIFHSDVHRRHAPQRELSGGEFMAAVETPERVETILGALQAASIGSLEAPETFGEKPMAAVHTRAYLDFLKTAHQDWRREYPDQDALPLIWPMRGLRQRLPASIDGKLGYYSADAGTPITAGSWDAACGGVDIALSATRAVLAGERVSYGLCRPPGHHAAADLMCGYCFLNNAAIAAQWARDQGAERVAVLDIDYHHGNGTQDIFYARDDVLFVAIHADPDQEYPYFLGFADEAGEGRGKGFNLNLPLPWGTSWPDYTGALDQAVARIEGYRPDILIVSFGADTFKEDPISRFTLETLDFAKMGAAIAQLGLPTVVLQEGGYAVEALGTNVVSFLTGVAGDE